MSAIVDTSSVRDAVMMEIAQNARTAQRISHYLHQDLHRTQRDASEANAKRCHSQLNEQATTALETVKQKRGRRRAESS